MKAIVNTRVVLPDSLIPDGMVLMDKGRICGVAPRNGLALPPDAELIDAKGKYTAPGFVDLHCHGGGGHWFHDAPAKAAAYFLSRGHTTMLATLFYNLSMEELISAAAGVRAAMGSGAGRAIAGIYMEGPYLNPKYGSDAKNNKWRDAVRPEDCRRMVRAFGDLVRVWCVAPEREGIGALIDAAAPHHPVFSAAHTEASPGQIYGLVPRGLKLQTHHTNATGAPGRGAGIRAAGVDVAALLCEKIYIELICDSLGVHVDPFTLRLALKCKGRGRVILVSDSTSFEHSAGDMRIAAPDLCYDAQGELAGSRLTLPMACRNLMAHTGAGLCDAVRFATYNPAKLLGMENEIGCVRPGGRANLVVMDDMCRVERVFFMGEEVKAAREDGN